MAHRILCGAKFLRVLILRFFSMICKNTVKFQNKPRGLYFSKALFEGPIFGVVYVRREICVSKSVGLACSGKEIYHFCFVLLCIWGQIPSTSPPGGLHSEEQFNGGFFGLPFWGAYMWRGLFSEFYGKFLQKLTFFPQKFTPE